MNDKSSILGVRLAFNFDKSTEPSSHIHASCCVDCGERKRKSAWR